jgi:hypothetical protein
VRDGAVIVLPDDAEIRSPVHGRYTSAWIASLSRDEKLELPILWQGVGHAGIWEIVPDPVPDGMRAVEWEYTVDGDHVRAIPTLAPEPMTVDALATVILATVPGVTAESGAPLTLGKHYPAGVIVTEGDRRFEVLQEFWHYDPNFGADAYASRLRELPPEGEADVIWEQRFPPNLYGQEYVGRVFTYDGRRYELTAPDTTAHPPPVRPDIWTDLGPVI